MIRFLPDTWVEAVLRPVAMASPDGGVYVELIAPDFRFVFAILLALALAWFAIVRREQRRCAPPVVLAVFTAVAFVPWLATTGNGRYFIAFLLIAGPLCVGLLHLLPLTKAFRLTAAVGMVLCQGFLIHQIDPWRTWGHVTWGDGPGFEVEVPRDVATQPATYVTLSSISYSLIAPAFHPASRWVNIANLHETAQKAADNQRAQALILAPGPLYAVFPTLPGGQERRHMERELAEAIDALLARQQLSLAQPDACRVMPSPTMARLDVHRKDRSQQDSTAVHGFWLCPLARRASKHAAEAVALPRATERVFEKLEGLCPRIFPPGAAVSLRIPAGAVRGYLDSDFKLYVLEDGRVWYKYFRALNPVLLGRVSDVMAPAFSMDCDRVRGRSGLPWDREI